MIFKVSTLSWLGKVKQTACQRRFIYKHIGGSTPLLYKTVGQVFDETADKCGDQTCLVVAYQNKRLSYNEMRNEADKFAAGLTELGVMPGDRVGLWTLNSAEWYIASLAAAKAGAISVYLNPLYRAEELKHCLNAVGVKVLIAAEAYRATKYVDIFEGIDPNILKSKPGKIESSVLPNLKTIISTTHAYHPSILSFDEVISKATSSRIASLREMGQKFSPDDASNIQFTSGTTGSPKGAILSHFNIVNNSNLISLRLNLKEKPHIMCFLGPLFHALGSVIAVLTCVHEAVPLVIPEGTFSSTKAAECVMNEKCTILVGTPTMYVDLIKVMEEKGMKPDHVEVALSGGAYASTVLFSSMYEKLGVKRVTSVYGLTETGPVVFMSKTTDDKVQQLTTVGYLMEHVEAKIVDETGAVVPENVPGELWVRAPYVMKGYWNDEKRTFESLTPEKWFKTGDQLTMSSDGYGKVVGRIKDMIIRGGENIHPADIEEFLSSHSGILEVQVIGLPDERLGEQVCACIRLKEGSKLTEDEVKQFCKGKIADYKIPNYVWFVNNFPRTSSGKIQKFKLREQALKHFNLKENAK